MPPRRRTPDTTATPAEAVIPEETLELPPPAPADRWSPDILGAGFEVRTLHLLEDEEGPVDATLVRHRPADDAGAFPGTPSVPSFAVLYLHGWNDYFYHRDVARRWTQLGGAFYALDLRKYGRSLREHQTRGYMESLSVYDEDIHEALRVIRREQGVGTDLVLMGHSTGGLTASLWAHRHPGALRGLVLNAPWLELQGSALLRGVAQPIIGTLARTQPKTIIPVADSGYYQRSLHGWTDEDGPVPDGEHDDPFVTGWNPHPVWRVVGPPIRAGWLAAVLTGHAQVATGLEIDCPVLVMTSGKTLISQTKWSPELRTVDTVLDVEQIRRRALRLGSHVTLVRLDGAIHDVMLSSRQVRQRAHAELARWARAYVLR